MGEKANENIKTCYLDFFESASKRQEAFIDFLVLKLKSERSLKYRLDAKLKKIKNDEVDVDYKFFNLIDKSFVQHVKFIE